MPDRSTGPRIVKTVSDAGVVNRVLTATATEKTVSLSGGFGVFYPGNLVAYLYDTNGVRTRILQIQGASPLQLVDLNKEVAVSSAESRVSIYLVDEEGMDRGSLGETPIPRANHEP